MKQTVWLNLNIVLLVIPFLSACTDTGISSVDFEQRRKWESMGITDYVIQQQRQCFCVDGGRIAQVVIRADTVYSVTAADTLSNPLQGGDFLSVIQLFDFIERARAFPSAIVEVTYDDRYGYPERIFVNYLQNAIDDEIAYMTSGLVPIR